MVSSKSDTHTLTKEEYPEPRTKAGFPALIREILDQPGGVHRISMERGQPVRVWRWVEKNDLLEQDPTLDEALSRADVIEYVNPDIHRTAPEELFHMLAILKSEKAVPVCWATGRDQAGLLRKWLRVDEQGVPFDESEFLGVPVERLKSLPEDTLLLCGAGHANAGPEEVTFVVKTAMEVRHVEEKNDRAIGGVGDSATRGRSAVGTPQNGATRDCGSTWYPPSFIRSRFSRS